MRNLSPATRQKLAILLKSKAAGQAPGPNMAAPPAINSPMKVPQIPQMAPPNSPAPPNSMSASSMDKQAKFKQLKSKFKF